MKLRVLKKKLKQNCNYYETDEDDNKYNYCGSVGPVGVKNDR